MEDLNAPFGLIATLNCRLQSTDKVAFGVVVFRENQDSSVVPFARTLNVHRNTVKRQWEKFQEQAPTEDTAPQQLDLLTGSVDNDNDHATLEEKQLQAEEDAQFESVSAATMGPLEELSAKELFAHEQKLLDEMTDVAAKARGKSDPRTEKTNRLDSGPDVP